MRRTLVVDDKLDELILERDSVRIQLSLLGEKAIADTDELAALRIKARELEALIRSHQQTT